MPRGGARAGAGRKRTAEKFARPIAAAEKRIADRLPQLIDNLLYLADGGYELGSTAEVSEPAGTIFVDATEDGISGQVLAFPNLPKDQLVVVRRTRTVSIAAPDRTANQYLVDRILGKTIAPLEVSGPGGDPIVFSLHLGEAEPTG